MCIRMREKGEGRGEREKKYEWENVGLTCKMVSYLEFVQSQI